MVFAPVHREPLPRLADLIDFMNETGVNANIEIKSNEEELAVRFSYAIP